MVTGRTIMVLWGFLKLRFQKGRGPEFDPRPRLSFSILRILEILHGNDEEAFESIFFRGLSGSRGVVFRGILNFWGI